MQPRIGCGRAWQVYSLGVLEGIGSEAEACHSSKIVWLLYIMLFSFVN